MRHYRQEVEGLPGVADRNLFSYLFYLFGYSLFYPPHGTIGENLLNLVQPVLAVLLSALGGYGLG
jgi:hypothetical protein